MRVLVVGGGGREHALAWGLARSPLVEELIVAPGNAGIASLARCVPAATEDVAQIVALAERESVDLVIVGPEAPLVAGLADALRARGVPTLGPSMQAARIEGSKRFAKAVMLRGSVPTARGESFSGVATALGFVDRLGGRAVVKADGLAGGKGVTVALDRDAARCAIEDALVRGAFGRAGESVVVEEILEGPEVSAFALCDGTSVAPLVLSQDFKRVGVGDVGPNTGGMGAYSPLPWIDHTTEQRIWDIVDRSIGAMRERGIDYRGLLYAGLMLTADGPKVLEFNCRFGDPEAEVVIPRLRSDLAELLLACATGRLADVKIDWTPDAAVAVILASGGYPGRYETGVPIHGLKEATAAPEALVFHAGTAKRDGSMVTAGGRVLALTGMGPTLAEARARSYEACSRISFEDMTYRTDIAAEAAADDEREGSG